MEKIWINMQQDFQENFSLTKQFLMNNVQAELVFQ